MWGPLLPHPEDRKTVPRSINASFSLHLEHTTAIRKYQQMIAREAKEKYFHVLALSSKLINVDSIAAVKSYTRPASLIRDSPGSLFLGMGISNFTVTTVLLVMYGYASVAHSTRNFKVLHTRSDASIPLPRVTSQPPDPLATGVDSRSFSLRLPDVYAACVLQLESHLRASQDGSLADGWIATYRGV
jgi:hypothetical protein